MTIVNAILDAGIIQKIEWQEKDKSSNTIASFTDKYRDHKIHDDKTGMNYLKIDVEIDVKHVFRAGNSPKKI